MTDVKDKGLEKDNRLFLIVTYFSREVTSFLWKVAFAILLEIHRWLNLYFCRFLFKVYHVIQILRKIEQKHAIRQTNGERWREEFTK